jgi:general stress protein YciG
MQSMNEDAKAFAKQGAQSLGGVPVNDDMRTASNGTGETPVRRKERRGFASMSPEKQREIASKGGRAAHLKGTAHEWTSEEARSAGRKGGMISRGGRGRLATGDDAEAADRGAGNSDLA